ncbi:hypothetical protein X975_05213, partial [Stegodyphus mimosarum]
IYLTNKELVCHPFATQKAFKCTEVVILSLSFKR